MPEILTNAVDFLSKGGIVMLFIFLCSIGAIILVIERFIALRADKKQTNQLTKPLLEALGNAHIERAYSLTDSHPCALSAIASTALKHQGHSRESIQEAMTDEARQQDARLNRFIPMIGSIASISPLLGLLGTVTGMVSTFEVITLYGNQNPVLMADGISEALISTQSGLLVAFPLTLLKQRLDERIEILKQEMELGATVIDNYFMGKNLSER